MNYNMEAKKFNFSEGFRSQPSLYLEVRGTLILGRLGRFAFGDPT